MHGNAFYALWGALSLCAPLICHADGAVQHAMPAGGYIGTAQLLPPARRGAVQHAMPAGGYIGTATATVLVMD